jgi:hypothetical protein
MLGGFELLQLVLFVVEGLMIGGSELLTLTQTGCPNFESGGKIEGLKLHKGPKKIVGGSNRSVIL